MLRYPYVAAEILSSESQAVAGAFFKTKKSTPDGGEKEPENNADEVVTDLEGICY